MSNRKKGIESHVSESEFEPLDEFFVYLDSVPDSVLEGQDVPEKEPDDRKQGKKMRRRKRLENHLHQV